MTPRKDKKEYPPTESFLKRSEPDQQNGWITESHPSYGVIGLHRYSSTHMRLFDSAVNHMHFISLTIHEATKHIDGERERVQVGDLLAEVRMTESQFAQMITQPNSGDGVSCTIHRMPNEQWDAPFGSRPDPPEPPPVLDKYNVAVVEKAKEMVTEVTAAMAIVDKMISGEFSTSKANLKDTRQALNHVVAAINSYMPYLIKEVHEHMENIASQAKVEFETYVNQRSAAIGLAGLKAGAPSLPSPSTRQLTEGGE